MAVTIADFRTRFEEFSEVPDAVVTAYLDASTVYTAEDVGSIYDEVILWRTADSIARRQWGYNANLKNPSETTTYGRKVRELLEASPLRGMVVSDAVVVP